MHALAHEILKYRRAAPQAATWMGPVSPLAIKLVAFGELAFI
jgi:hypothetical protein